MKENERKNLGLYIHIPFCKSKCAYCDFYSFPTEDDELFKHYNSAVLLQMQDMKKSAEDYEVDTVFIGGGTPTVHPQKLMLELIGGIKRNFNFRKDAEFTMEANPATTDFRMLQKYRKAGVNRLSIGLQSIHFTELSTMCRIHNVNDFEQTYYDARDAGFDNINVDVMFGLPGQTMKSFMETLDYVCKKNPEHISVYGLKIEEGTPFYERKNTLELPDEDTEYEMYLAAIEFLESKGYEHYEISNFARPGYRCLHNMKYWNCDEYLGLGVAAHSDFLGKRFGIIKDIQTYIDALEVIDYDKSIFSEMSEITQYERMCEYTMLRMRLSDGVSVSAFGRRFNYEFDKVFGNKLKMYINGGFVKFENGAYSFTPKGMYVSNYILSSVLDFKENDLIKNI